MQRVCPEERSAQFARLRSNRSKNWVGNGLAALMLSGFFVLAGGPARAGASAPAAEGVSDSADDGERSLRFAEWLFSERDFYRAITEYERFLFEHPLSPRAPWVRFRIGESYLAGGRTEAARSAFDVLSQSAGDPVLRQWSSLAAARSLFQERRFLQSLRILEGFDALAPDPELRGFGLYLSGCIYLKTGLPEQARAAFSSIWAGHPLAGQATYLASAGAEIEKLPRKNPVWAGVLSLLPGLGHAYLGEFDVALTALVWNGLFGFAAVDAFRRGSVGVGTLLAALELFWYSGTIFGAVAGAERFNHDAQQNFLERLDRNAGLDLPFPDPNAAGMILLQGRFR